MGARDHAFESGAQWLRDQQKSNISLSPEIATFSWQDDITGSGTATFLVRYICLPDTLDPREKKG